MKKIYSLDVLLAGWITLMITIYAIVIVGKHSLFKSIPGFVVLRDFLMQFFFRNYVYNQG